MPASEGLQHEGSSGGSPGLKIKINGGSTNISPISANPMEKAVSIPNICVGKMLPRIITKKPGCGCYGFVEKNNRQKTGSTPRQRPESGGAGKDAFNTAIDKRFQDKFWHFFNFLVDPDAMT